MTRITDDTYSTGWIPDTYDDRDWDFQQAFGTSNQLPLSHDLTEYVSTFLFQGSWPSCVGHAIATQIMIEERIAGLRGSIPSRAYIYAMARAQYQDELLKTGTYPRLAYNAVKRWGCPPEPWWPYNTRDGSLYRKPNYNAKRQASSRIGLKYYRITDDISDNVRQAIADNHPVTIGTEVIEHMHNYTYGEVLYPPPPGQATLGGHFMLITGYERDKFTVVNSWRGTPLFRMSEEMLEWEESSDFYVITGWSCLNETQS